MSHGPGMHGAPIMVLVIIVLLGGLAYGLVHLVKSRRGRTGVDRDPRATAGSDRRPET